MALPEGPEVYPEYSRRELGVSPAPVEIWADAERIPVLDWSENLIISSHVVEHLPGQVPISV